MQNLKKRFLCFYYTKRLDMKLFYGETKVQFQIWWYGLFLTKEQKNKAQQQALMSLRSLLWKSINKK